MHQWMSMAVLAAANLGIADHIDEVPRSADDLAERLQLHAGCLYRLMRGLATVGIFREAQPRCFVGTALSNALRSGAAGHARDIIRCFGLKSALKATVEYEQAIVTGRPAFEAALGSKSPFDFVARHPEEARTYDAGMTALATIHSTIINAACDFSRIKTLADIGGGQGVILASILKKNPTQKGVLFDLPHVVAGAREILESYGVSARCEIRSGDLRVDVPQNADGYILKNILHGHGDAECSALLEVIYKRASEKARVFIIEMMPPNSPSVAHGSFDLFLLLGGMESRMRTPSELEALLREARFNVLGTRQIGGLLSVLEAERI
jgi:hypothetical protein